MSKNPYRHCQFLIGANAIDQLPDDQGMEIAIAGTSNVGKSSVINTITANSTLARTSKTPGRTQQINVFEMDATRKLVDLPGYGYAQVPNAMRIHWGRMLNRYFCERKALAGLLLITDIRRGLKPADWQMLDWSRQAALPVHILLNKSDKLSRSAATRKLATLQNETEKYNYNISMQLFSALKKTGVDAARSILNRWLKMS